MGLSLFSKRKRPLHLGAYPMEKIKRVEKTTTLIIDDEVKRTPAIGRLRNQKMQRGVLPRKQETRHHLSP